MCLSWFQESLLHSSIFAYASNSKYCLGVWWLNWLSFRYGERDLTPYCVRCYTARNDRARWLDSHPQGSQTRLLKCASMLKVRCDAYEYTSPTRMFEKGLTRARESKLHVSIKCLSWYLKVIKFKQEHPNYEYRKKWKIIKFAIKLHYERRHAIAVRVEKYV